MKKISNLAQFTTLVTVNAVYLVLNIATAELRWWISSNVKQSKLQWTATNSLRNIS